MKMKSLTVFESGVIGFLVGAIVSTYILCVESTGGYIGHVLSIVSFAPAIALFAVPQSIVLPVDFLFFLLVYTVYGSIVGFFVMKSRKTLYYAIPLILLLALAAIIEQTGQPASSVAGSSYSEVSIAHSRSASGAAQQYFGNEAVGDLNGDGKNDVAFVLWRSDPDRGTLYYLSAALSVANGHQGTNLVFLGNDVEPRNIGIVGGIIAVSYVGSADATTTAPRYFYARVANGTLEQILLSKKSDSLLWGSIDADGSVLAFKPCGGSETMALGGSSTLVQLVHNGLDSAAGATSSTVPTMLGALVGTRHDISGVNASTTVYSSEFSIDNVINLIPNSSCM